MDIATRIMIFYDGAYFKKGQMYFRYKENRGWFSLPALHSLFEQVVAAKAKSPADSTRIAASHYYDGRTSTHVATGADLQKERNFEMALVHAGIIPHYLPVREMPVLPQGAERLRYHLAQKGVDVSLAVDALDFAHADRLHVAVLITGDEDLVPLVRKVVSLGKTVLVAHFNFALWTDARGMSHPGTGCHRSLQDAASWCLDFNALVRDPDWCVQVRSLFFRPKDTRAA